MMKCYLAGMKNRQKNALQRVHSSLLEQTNYISGDLVVKK